MPRKAAPKSGEMTVKVAHAISDGEFGFLPVGATFTPADKEAGEQLKARKLAE